ncbi:MAG: hypothetical protein AAF921_27150 [Cyanobacteria bacterium P01_D01_bin.44]
MSNPNLKRYSKPLTESGIDIEDDERRHWDYHYDEVGSVPGKLVIEQDAAPPELLLIDYQPTEALCLELATPAEVAQYLDRESVSWVDVQGLGRDDCDRNHPDRLLLATGMV